MNPITYLIEVKRELGNVTWPSAGRVLKLTGVVILASAAIGAYTGALDYIFAGALKAVISR